MAGCWPSCIELVAWRGAARVKGRRVGRSSLWRSVVGLERGAWRGADGWADGAKVGSSWQGFGISGWGEGKTAMRHADQIGAMNAGAG